MFKKFLVFILLCCTLMTLRETSEAQEVMAVAAGIAPCIEEIMDSYVATGKEPLSIVKGPCGALARQTEAGAPFGLVMMAEPRWPKWMVKKGLLKDVKTFATGQLVLWSGGSQNPNLLDLCKKKVAIPQPDATAYGMAARDFLIKKDLWKDFQRGDILMVNSAPQAVMSVKNGTTHWAFVPKTAAIKAGGSYVMLEGAILPQVGGLTEKAGPEARSFWRYCLSDRTDSIWLKWGLSLEGRP